ncbi:MAG TPA: hypothetical protein VGT79_11290 [Xanthomonadaceae bacterium]|nr:hypothetical protein [Xanthomonadaceae bacterium]
MYDLPQLWLPILVTAVAVFIASSLIHMVFKWHNSDYRKLSNEDDVRTAIRAGSPAPGQYVLPHCADMKDMQGEAMRQKFIEGPIGLFTLRRNGPPSMGGSLIQWFMYTLLVAAIAGAMALRIFGMHGSAHGAGRLVGLVSFLTYTGGSVQMGIWMGKPWGAVAKDILDGLIYAIISVLVFTWLWP